MDIGKRGMLCLYLKRGSTGFKILLVSWYNQSLVRIFTETMRRVDIRQSQTYNSGIY